MTDLDLTAIRADIPLAERSTEMARHLALDHVPALCDEVERLRKFAGEITEVCDDLASVMEDSSVHPDVRLLASNTHLTLMKVYYALVFERGQQYPPGVGSPTDSLNYRLAQQHRANGLNVHQWKDAEGNTDWDAYAFEETDALRTENERLRHALNQSQADHMAEEIKLRSKLRPLEAENERLRGVIAEVEKVVNNPYWGTYWGQSQVPQEDLRRALGGGA